MPLSFQCVGLVGRSQHEDAAPVLNELVRLLQSRGAEILLEQRLAELLPVAGLSACALEDIGEKADLGIVVGGDGSLLGAARTLARSDAAFLIAVSRDDDARDPESKTIFAQAAEAAGRTAIVEVYAADHGWTVPDSPVYNAAVANKAFADLLGFYGEYL